MKRKRDHEHDFLTVNRIYKRFRPYEIHHLQPMKRKERPFDTYFIDEISRSKKRKILGHLINDYVTQLEGYRQLMSFKYRNLNKKMFDMAINYSNINGLLKQCNYQRTCHVIMSDEENEIEFLFKRELNSVIFSDDEW